MLAIIGGTGLNQIEGFAGERIVPVETEYDTVPVNIARGHLDGHEVCFLPRHGQGHTVPPHRINYRANIQALKRLGVRHVVAVNAVGGIHECMGPGAIGVPGQIVDYSWGREHTFFNGAGTGVEHADMTEPYDEALRQVLIAAADRAGIPVWPAGVYACTQGPRLETAAEVRRLQRDGCDMIGMTGMPEAALAREVDLAYASIALSVNWAAGLTDDVITMESIQAVLADGMGQVLDVLRQVPHQLSLIRFSTAC